MAPNRCKHFLVHFLTHSYLVNDVARSAEKKSSRHIHVGVFFKYSTAPYVYWFWARLHTELLIEPFFELHTERYSTLAALHVCYIAVDIIHLHLLIWSEALPIVLNILAPNLFYINWHLLVIPIQKFLQSLFPVYDLSCFGIGWYRTVIINVNLSSIHGRSATWARFPSEMFWLCFSLLVMGVLRATFRWSKWDFLFLKFGKKWLILNCFKCY